MNNSIPSKIECYLSLLVMVLSYQPTLGQNTQSRMVGPTADFTVDQQCVPFFGPATFTDASTISQGPATYTWTFQGANPSTATGPGPHTVQYFGTGNFSASLTVTDAQGTDTETKVDFVTISNVISPSANFVVPSECGLGDGEITITDIPLAMASPYLIEYDKGQSHIGPAFYPQDSLGYIHLTGLTGGEYSNILLHDGNCTFPVPSPIVLEPAISPTANFSVDQVTGTGPYQAYLGNLSQNSSTWEWIVGGSSSTTSDYLFYPLCAFLDSSEVCLVAFNDYGCSDTLCAWVYPHSSGVIGLEQNGMGLQMYPIPANDLVTLELTGHSGGRLTLLDLQGRKLLETEVSSGRNEIPVSALPRDVYVVQFIGGSGHTWRGMMVKN